MNTRNTIQFQLVLDAVRDLASHNTAEEIYNHVYKNNPFVSRGTVYRNLNKLVEKGLIRRLNSTSGAERYDHDVCSHVHYHCTCCDRLFDTYIDTSKVEEAINSLNTNFTSYDVVLNIVCYECKGKNNE